LFFVAKIALFAGDLGAVIGIKYVIAHLRDKVAQGEIPPDPCSGGHLSCKKSR